MTSGQRCRHLAHGIILTFCLSFAMGAGEASPSSLLLLLFADDLEKDSMSFMNLMIFILVFSILLHLYLIC